MVKRVRLTKLSSNPNAMRTSFVEGFTTKLPVAGERFSITSEGLEFGVRYVCTSPVKAVREDGSFDTENSTYRVEELAS